MARVCQGPPCEAASRLPHVTRFPVPHPSRRDESFPATRRTRGNNPEAFVAFTDQGCASQIRYGALPVPDAGYAACLTSAYANLRWSCATTGTHFVMLHTARPLGGF
jgi:hypothetical protein